MPLPGIGGGVTAASQQASKNRRAQGIDLSRWENSINPYKATSPLDFVILKASEGKGYSDPNFNMFLGQTQSVPIKGAYHYLRSGVSTNAQVQTFLQTVQGKGLDFYAVDVENYNNRVDPLFAQQARDFIQQVQSQTGKPVLLYTDRDIYYKLFNRPSDQKIPLWIADPDVSRPGVKNWAFWQASFGAPAQKFGVTGAQGVDFNYFAGSPDQLRQWLNSLSPTQGLGGLGHAPSPGQQAKTAHYGSILQSLGNP